MARPPRRSPSSLVHQPPSALVPPRSRRGSPHRYWSVLGALVLLSGAVGGVVGSLKVGMQLMVNPQALAWVNQYVPGWIPSPASGLPSAQTLPEIQAAVRQAGLASGSWIELGANTSVVDGQTPAQDYLLAVLQPRPGCQGIACNAITELRVYQSVVGERRRGQALYRLVTQLEMAGPEKSFVIAPIVDSASADQGASQALPLTQLKRFVGKVPTPGQWLSLSGQESGQESLLYGTLVYYNPARLHLGLKLQWTSPAGEEPVWQEVTGGGSPELIVNQTVGLEPHFQIYQVKPLNFVSSPVQLEPISLLEPNEQRSPYGKALMLARSGLWSVALQWLQSVQRQHPSVDQAQLQAQIDLIRWHAQVAKNQSEQSWANPGQQILVNLMDGRWERALTLFKASANNSHETVAILQADTGRLQRRIKAVLQVDPTNAAAKTWGGLLLAAQRGRPAAIAWFKQQPQTSATAIATLTTLAQRLDPLFTDVAAPALPPEPPTQPPPPELTTQPLPPKFPAQPLPPGPTAPPLSPEAPTAPPPPEPALPDAQLQPVNRLASE